MTSRLPLQFFIAMCASFLQRRQQTLIEYLIEENLVLRKKLGPTRLSFTDAERRRLAVKAKSLGRNMLCKYATIAHPDTLLRWYQKLIAEKYDGSKNRGSTEHVSVRRRAQGGSTDHPLDIKNKIRKPIWTTESILRHNVVSKWVGVRS